MSKEKIIGLTVLGVLSVTLVSVIAWRFLGSSSAEVVEGTEGTTEVAAQGEAGQNAAPTVLDSASTGGNSDLAARLAGKTKIHGGWESASGSRVPATPPEGASRLSLVSDTEPHTSYMPRDAGTIPALPAGDGARYGAATEPAQVAIAEGTDNAALPGATQDSESAAQASIASTHEPGHLPESSSLNESFAAAVPTEQPLPNHAGAAAGEAYAGAGAQGVPPAEVAAETAKLEPAVTELVAVPEAENVRIAESALPGGDLSTPAEPKFAASSAETQPPARFASDARFAAAPRYTPTQEVETTATPPTSPVTTSPITNTAEPYRESAYREPAAAAEASRYGAAASGVSAAGTSSAVASNAGTRSGSPEKSVYAPQSAPSYSAPADAYAVENHASPTEPSSRAYAGAAGTGSAAVAPRRAQPTSTGVPTRENTGTYHVEPGDSFWKISEKVYGQGGYFKALEAHNRARFANSAGMQVGDEVQTPSMAELRELYSGLCPKERVNKSGIPVQTASLPVEPAGEARTYEVQEGDTLFDIARYELGAGSRWPEIYALNRKALGEDMNYVRPGILLVLPGNPVSETEEAGPSYSGDVLTRQPGATQR